MYSTKEELNSIESIDKVCDRILLELDEEYPWLSIIRYLVLRIKRLESERNECLEADMRST